MSDLQAPPPPYAPAQTTPSRRSGPATISDLPLILLHRILSLTLDPISTPSRWSGDIAEEKIRRLWALFRALRCVNKQFYLVSTNILRTHYLPTYQSLLPPGTSSDPFPHSAESSKVATSIFGDRTRETAVFDRFIAVRVGESLRKIETELYEESEAESDIFKRLQPSARIEDLLRTLPAHLVKQHGEPRRMLPLPLSHFFVNLTPGWAQLFLHSHPFGSFPREKIGRDLVCEVRRQREAEGTVRRIRDGLEDMSRGLVEWGGRVL